MKITHFILTVLLTAIHIVSLGGCSAKGPRNTHEPLTFLEHKDFDLYQPAGQGPFPGVIVVHGGGWEGRSRKDMDSLCRKVAARGFVAINASYRFAPKSIYPAQLEDLRKIYDHILENSKAYKIDASKLGGWGYSAGAHLISLLATMPHKTENDPGRKFSAIVSGGGPYDLTKYSDSRLINQFLGKPLIQDPQLYETASPLYHVSSDDPPFFLYHGRNDWTVSFDQMRAMKRKLEEKKVDVETYSIPLLGHSAVFLLSGEAVERGLQFLDEYLRESTYAHRKHDSPD